MAFVSAAPVAARGATASLARTVLPSRQQSSAQPAARRRARVFTPTAMAGGPPVRSTECDTPLKQFLDRLKGLGTVRLIVTNGAGVMETITTWDGLFFATIPKGEYANLIKPKENLDLHLRLGGVAAARFETGVSRSASKAPTYIVRILGEDKEEVVLSVFLQWDKEPEDIAKERIDHWLAMKTELAGDDGTVHF
jgi:Haem utilisation ChuX/HutX